MTNGLTEKESYAMREELRPGEDDAGRDTGRDEAAPRTGI